ncbi:MAG: HEAT repeat domain-containing protein [Gemmataceae bacterium]|nr:HEAT repeat domain-containing protein [Gemmataceae bacterium]MCI0738004.1 HEAT repeat domain-containing protein [Gemmataceae bacterium]
MQRFIVPCIFLVVAAFVVRGDYPTIGVDKARFKELKDNLNNNNPQVRWEAAQALGQIAEEIQACLGRLEIQLLDSNPRVRLESATALGQLGPSANRAVFRLRQALKKEQVTEIKTKMIQALVSMRPFSKEAIPDFLEHVKDKDRNVRRAVVVGLGLFERDSKIAVPALIEALKDPDVAPNNRETSISHAALVSLRQVGNAAKEASGVLFDLAKGDDFELARRAIGSLAYIDPENPDLLPFYLRILTDPKRPTLRQSAAYGLSKLGVKGKEAIPALLEALKATDYGNESDSRYTKGAVLQALGNMGSAAKHAVPLIREFENHADAYLRVSAEKALEKILGKSD